MGRSARRSKVLVPDESVVPVALFLGFIMGMACVLMVMGVMYANPEEELMQAKRDSQAAWQLVHELRATLVVHGINVDEAMPEEITF